ncbi:class I SAM-dependent methyltransferase [Halorubrum gandharaense]
MDPQATYDRIASHFSKTREYAWPEVASFLEDRDVGEGGEASVALDVGCGNGRHTELLSGVADRTVGIDVSRGLLREARQRAADRGFADTTEFVHGDAAALPVADDAVDLAVYVAALHHLRPRAQRVASLSELARVLRPGAVALVSAWSTAHDTFDREEGFDTTVDWTLPGGETVPRYYHIYAPDEFADDLRESDLDPVDVGVSSGNCYAVVRAPSA